MPSKPREIISTALSKLGSIKPEWPCPIEKLPFAFNNFAASESRVDYGLKAALKITQMSNLTVNWVIGLPKQHGDSTSKPS